MNRNSTLLVALIAVGLLAPLIVVVALIAIITDHVDDCAPQGGTVELAGQISAPVDGQVGVAQANIPSRAGSSGFRRSMPRVLASKPDFVSLNEQRSRSLREIESAAAGYEGYRDKAATGQAAGTVVLWNAARWQRGAAGRALLVPRGPQKWDAGRSATYATLTGQGAGNQGAVVSIVSVHHMVNPAKYGPDPGLRQQLYGQGMDRLTDLVDQLAKSGPVFVAGDMNTRASQKSAGWSAAAKMAAAGYGWVDHSVDFIFYPRSSGIRPAGSWTGSMASDHQWVAARFDMNGPTAGSNGSLGRGETNTQGAATSSAVAAGAVETVAGLDPEQTRHAATIVEAGRELAVPQRGLVVAIATALQESGLRNLDHGDRDSLGLFQQRPSTGWGTPAQIRDTRLAAMAFYGRANHTDNTGLLNIIGWEQLPLTAAAQAVQRSGFPEAYADDEDLANNIVTQLDPDAAATLAAATAPSYCATSAATPVAAGSCAPVDTAAENGLTPDALLVLRCVQGTFGPHTYGGVGERASNPTSDHPAGRAVDVMISDWSSAAGIAEGDAIAAWLQEHQAGFGITYLIWRGRIWSAGDGAGPGAWRAYSHPSGASDPTSRHLDHVHVSVSGAAGTGITPVSNARSAGAVAMPLPAGTYTDRQNWHEYSSHWANWHTGNDLSAPCGTPVLAVHAGTVRIDRTQSWAGRQLVKVSQGPGQVATWYAHMSSVTVADGQQVAPGQQLGAVGAEGNSTGCHLHLELHARSGTDIYGDDNTDPMPWISSQLG